MGQVKIWGKAKIWGQARPFKQGQASVCQSTEADIEFLLGPGWCWQVTKQTGNFKLRCTLTEIANWCWKSVYKSLRYYLSILYLGQSLKVLFCFNILITVCLFWHILKPGLPGLGPLSWPDLKVGVASLLASDTF